MNKEILTTSRLASVVIMAAFVLGTVQARAEKIGVVDMQKAVQSTSAGKKAKDSLDAEFKKRKDSLDKKKKDVESMGADLEKKKSVLSEEVYQKKAMEVQEEMMKFQKVVGENQLEIQKKEKELVEPILAKLKKAMEKVAQEKGFSVIIERGQSVAYVTKDADITDAVIAAYEKDK